jgi:hypothetical protein
MKRHIAVLGAVFVVGVAAATTASARDSFAISIGGPGFGVGYSAGGYRFAYAAPPLVYSPAVVYSGLPYGYAYAPAPVVYGRYERDYVPGWRHRYGRRY